jgi:Mrp family chromosome partitioning ATPase
MNTEKDAEAQTVQGMREEVLQARMAQVKHTVIVMSGKGGVGKTTVAANLAVALSVVQLMGKLDGSIIVTTPQELALLDSRKAVNFSRILRVPVIGIIENMSGFVCPYCGKDVNIFKYGGEQAARELSVPFLGRVPLDPQMVEAADSGAPFVLQQESRVRQAFEEIVEKVRAFVEGEGGAEEAGGAVTRFYT